MKAIKMICVMILAACLVVIGCVQEVTKPVIEVTIDEGLLEQLEKARPQEVFVFEIIPGDPNYWMEVSQKMFDMQGEKEEGEELITLMDSSKYLEVRKISNSLFFGQMNDLWKSGPTPESPAYQGPSDAEAEEIAMKWLQRSGFMEEDMKALKISITDEVFELTKPGNEGEPQVFVVGKNVEVHRTINDLFVYGHGSKIKMYLGENREIDGYMAVWRQWQPSSSVLGHLPGEEKAKGKVMKPMDATAAFKALKKNPLDNLPLALVDRIHVDKVNFGYYSRPAAERQRYLQPVYVFSGMAYGESPEGEMLEVPYNQYVLALAEPMESIWPPKKLVKPDMREAADTLLYEEEEKDEIVLPED